MRTPNAMEIAEEENTTLLTIAMKNTRISVTRTIPRSRQGDIARNNRNKDRENRMSMVNSSNYAKRAPVPEKKSPLKGIRALDERIRNNLFCVKIARSMTATDSIFSESTASADSGVMATRSDRKLSRISTSQSMSISSQRSPKRRLNCLTSTASILDEDEFGSKGSQDSNAYEHGNRYQEASTALAREHQFLCGYTRLMCANDPESKPLCFSEEETSSIAPSRDDPPGHNESIRNFCISRCEAEFDPEYFDDDFLSIEISQPSYRSQSSSDRREKNKVGVTTLMSASSGDVTATLDPSDALPSRPLVYPEEISFVDNWEDMKKSAAAAADTDSQNAIAALSDAKQCAAMIQDNGRNLWSAGRTSLKEKFSDDSMVEESGLFKGIDCLGHNGALTIPMAESDIYSHQGDSVQHADTEDEGFEYDHLGHLESSTSFENDDALQSRKPTASELHLDKLASSSAKLRSRFSALVESFSDVTGPRQASLPVPDIDDDNNDGDDEDDNTEYYETGLMSPIKGQRFCQSPTYSVDYNVMLLPSQLQFCNIVADAVVGASSASSGYDLQRQESCEDEARITDLFEEDIANEFVKTFAHFRMPAYSGSSKNSADNTSQGSRFESCNESDSFDTRVGKGIVANHDAHNGEQIADHTSKKEILKSEDAVTVASQERSVCKQSDAKTLSTNAQAQQSQKNQRLVKPFTNSTDEDIRQTQPLSANGVLMVSANGVLMGTPKYDEASNSSCASSKAFSSTQVMHSAKKELPSRKWRREIMQVAPQIPANGTINAFPTVHPTAFASAPRLLHVEPEVSSFHTLGAHSQQFPTFCSTSSGNLGCPSMASTHGHTGAPHLQFPSLRVVQVAPNQHHEHLSDVINLRGSHEQVPQDNTEAVLAHSDEDLVTPQHSNRTGMNIPRGSKRDAFQTDYSAPASSTFSSFFRSLSCNDSTDNARLPRPRESKQGHTIDDTRSKSGKTNSQNNVDHAVDFASKADSEQNIAASISTGGGNAERLHLFVSSQDLTVQVSNRAEFRPSAGAIHTSVEKHTEDVSVMGSAITSTEVLPASAGQVTQLIASINDPRGSDMPVEHLPAEMTKIIKKKFSNGGSSNGSPGKNASNAVQLLHLLFDNGSNEEEEEELGDLGRCHCDKNTMKKHHVTDSVVISGNAIFLAAPKMKPSWTKRPDKNVSNSVDEVLNGLFSPSTMDESIVENLSCDTATTFDRSVQTEDQFLSEFANEFFDFFNVSSSTSTTAMGESRSGDGEINLLTTCSPLPNSVRTAAGVPNNLSIISDDGSDRDDATLNSLDFEHFGGVKERSKNTGRQGSKRHIMSSAASLESDVQVLKGPQTLFSDEDKRGPSNCDDDRNKKERRHPDLPCMTMVPYGSNVVDRESYIASSKPKMYTIFPLYPTLGRFNVDEFRLTFLRLGETLIHGAQPIANFLESKKVVGKLWSSKLQSQDLPPFPLTDQKLVKDLTSLQFGLGDMLKMRKQVDTPSPYLYVQTLPEHLGGDVATKAAINGAPATPRASSTLRPFSANAVSPSKDLPVWSFLDLERSIDASLDTFINDLLSPIDGTCEDDDIDEEKALQQLLSSEQCEENVDNMRNQEEMEQGIRLHLDPSTSSVENECSSNSSSGSGGGILKPAGGLLSYGDSTVRTDSSQDDHSESPKREDVDYVDGMTLGIAGLLGEEEIGRLDDPHVYLPELFAKEHFGSVSDMVQEIYLMKAIQLEQSEMDPNFDEDSLGYISSSEEENEREENNRIQEILIAHSLRIEQQKRKIEALQHELEQEIANVHSGICLMRHSLDKANSRDESLIDDRGWTDSGRDKYEPFGSIAESLTIEMGDDCYVDGFGGIEIQLCEIPQFPITDSLNDDQRSDHDVQASTESHISDCKDDDIDGLDSELEALVDFEQELRLEMESAEETFSRSTSLSASRSSIDETEGNVLELLPNSGSRCLLNSNAETVDQSGFAKNIVDVCSTTTVDSTLSKSSSLSALKSNTDDVDGSGVIQAMHSSNNTNDTNEELEISGSGSASTSKSAAENDARVLEIQVGLNKVGVHDWLNGKSEIIYGCCQPEHHVSPSKDKKMVTFASQNEEFYFSDTSDHYDVSVTVETAASKAATCDYQNVRLFVHDIFTEFSYAVGLRSRN